MEIQPKIITLYISLYIHTGQQFCTNGIFLVHFLWKYLKNSLSSVLSWSLVIVLELTRPEGFNFLLPERDDLSLLLSVSPLLSLFPLSLALSSSQLSLSLLYLTLFLFPPSLPLSLSLCNNFPPWPTKLGPARSVY